jgi:hypothetical protein
MMWMMISMYEIVRAIVYLMELQAKQTEGSALQFKQIKKLNVKCKIRPWRTTSPNTKLGKTPSCTTT